jgi:DNA-binding LacI/PurR family transcriptional regulator
MTRGVISEIHQAGLQIGRDIHIVTTVNKGSPVLELYADQLLQIEYDPACIVKGALDMLENLMNGVKPCDNPVLIAPSLQRPITATV